jgi:eukaryotic-like serine/threonine-protein kinase
MALVPGTRLGAYEILTLLGRGGMGEVYRARDTKLDRNVAIKVLPELFVSDPERVARFQREAKTLASLNHPHIGGIYGLEDAGGVHALVLELVEGPTLADRIAQGPIPLDEALPIARQIAEALEAAHEAAIIHRDLKPANIKLRPDGTVKVLDFGLAKALEPMSAVSANVTASPTITTPAMMTGIGMILGTAAYMSPEQAKGRAADKRSDVWAFGCVLYEILARKPAFAGETLTDVLATIVKDEPDLGALPDDAPDAIRSLVRRCLKKNPVERLHDIADARIEIDEALAQPATRSQGRPPSSSRGSPARIIPWTITGLLAMTWLLTLVVLRPHASPPVSVTRLELNMPAGVEVVSTNSPTVAISPDGTRLAFVGYFGGVRQIYVRKFDEFDVVGLGKATETASDCAFSPDGSALAFYTSDRVLRKISLTDGLVTTLSADADYTGGGLTWATDGWITFGRAGALWQISAAGGPERRLTTLDRGRDERAHSTPVALPGGKAILFTVVSGSDRIVTHIESLSFATGRRRRVTTDGSCPLYAASGHLLFFRDGSLLAAPFNTDTLEMTGGAVAVLSNVALDQLGSPMVNLSRAGQLAYVPSSNATKQLVWVSRRGVEEPITDTPRPYQNPRLSPDGHRIVVEVAGGDLWIQDTARGTFTRLTPKDTVGNTFSVWTPDARRVLFRTLTGIRWVGVDGGSSSHDVPGTTIGDIPTSVSPDGRTLAFIRNESSTSGDMYALSLDGESNSRPIVQTNGYDGGGQFSPDGRWMAYSSNESGQFEVYVRPYPGPDRKLPVSTHGGTHPKWNRNGRELFYRDGNKMMAVDIVTSPELRISSPHLLFEQRYASGGALSIASYDVSPDGQRFLMVKDESSAGRLNVVLNWFAELKARVPTK